MPRAPRVRAQNGDASRRAWLSMLKEKAVQRLPPDASPAMRAKLRNDVEHALRHHGPDDSALELQDILFGLIDEASGKLAEAKHQTQRAERKRTLLALAKSTLTSVIAGCPAYLVGSFDSDKRIHLTRAMWADLRAVLEKALSGAESEEDVRQRVEEHVAQWQRGQDHWWRPRPPSPARVLRGIRTAKRVVDAVNNTPELRQLVDTVIQVVQIKLRQRREAKGSSPSSSSS